MSAKPPTPLAATLKDMVLKPMQIVAAHASLTTDGKKARLEIPLFYLIWLNFMQKISKK